MGKIVAFNNVSTEGYFAAEDGNLGWVVPEEEIHREAVEALPGSDTILFGRRTYDQFESFWPRALEHPETTSDPHTPGRRSPTMHAMAVWINDATKLVFSRTRKNLTWKNSRALSEFDPRAVEAMKKQSGKDMLIFGSGTITSLLTEHGLIDEYQFVVGPILLGSGRPLISGVPKSTRLDLVDVKKYPSRNVMLRYTRRA